MSRCKALFRFVHGCHLQLQFSKMACDLTDARYGSVDVQIYADITIPSTLPSCIVKRIVPILDTTNNNASWMLLLLVIRTVPQEFEAMCHVRHRLKDDCGTNQVIAAPMAATIASQHFLHHSSLRLDGPAFQASIALCCQSPQNCFENVNQLPSLDEEVLECRCRLQKFLSGYLHSQSWAVGFRCVQVCFGQDLIRERCHLIDSFTL
mmetsp:Transcript_37515/g.65991  ORF Transcript_37515/g.65991 Transcript_37515/m.65991 type:complete len:207 (-) Transcript_37515:105-725(-)